MMRRLMLAAAVVLVASGGGRAWGQAQPEQPRLVLNTNGAVGAVRALAFSPDSSRLYAGGHDKAVQVWGFKPAAKGQPATALRVQTLRWEIARGWRGVIGALATSPTERKLALGGYSARGDAAGDIVIYDTSKGDVEKVLPPEGAAGHKQTIITLAFSPKGDRLASVSKDGEVRVWNAKDWTSRVARAGGKAHEYPQPAIFLSNDLLAVAEPGAGGWRVALYNVSGAKATRHVLPTAHSGRVTALARDGKTKRWASADEGGNIFSWNDKTSSRVRKGRVASALAFGPEQSLFAACNLDSKNQAVLEMWNVRTRKLVDSVVTGTSDNNHACATSDNQNTLAAVDVDTNELLTFRLRRGNQVIAKPLTGARATRLGGAGAALGSVAWAADGSYKVGFGKLGTMKSWKENEFGKVERVFDLSEVNIPTDKASAIEWRKPTDGADGWSAKIEKNGATVRVSKGNTNGEIALDPVWQGRARCFCFIPDAEGKPWGIAIGTDEQDGVFVYRMAEEGKWPLVRYFRDHRGWVTSVSASKDGKYLASSSADQMVNVWSLNGAREKDEAAKRNASWGAEFEVADGTLSVKKTMPEGIVARRNLRDGDKLKELKIVRDGKVVTITDGAEMLKTIEAGPLWDTYVFSVERAGVDGAFAVLLTPAWEPLASLFVDSQNEWAFWTPQGFYNASTSGDELFGWQINKGRDKKPDFFRADQFRNDLEKPDLMQKLLSAGNVPAAMAAAQMAAAPAAEVNSQLTELAAETATIAILSPDDDGDLQPGEKVRVRGEVKFPKGRPRGDYTVKAFINGIPAPAPQIAGEGETQTFEWSVAPPDPFNKVRLIVEEDETKEDAKFAYADVYLPAPVSARKQRLHVLGLAANDYPGGLKLNCAVQDLESVVESLKTNQGELYEVGTIRTLIDHDITRENVQKTVKEFCEELKGADSSDLAVIFLAGHGKAFGGDYFFVPPVPDVKKFDRATLDKVGIPWTQLREVAALPCRKVFMLDTCNSGNILIAEKPATDRLKNAVRPLKRAEVMVVSATDAYQEAGEAEDVGHGFFTQCLLEGIEGAADGMENREEVPARRDNRVDLYELVQFLETEVPKRTDDAQTPRSTPLELFELVFVPLVEYEEGTTK